MKKSPADYTPSERKWLTMREAEKAHQYHKCHGFQNYALTVAGDGIIGMTKSSKGYSALYLEIDGERVEGLVLEWDLQGKALQNHADLNLGSVHKNVRRI